MSTAIESKRFIPITVLLINSTDSETFFFHTASLLCNIRVIIESLNLTVSHSITTAGSKDSTGTFKFI